MNQNGRPTFLKKPGLLPVSQSLMTLTADLLGRGVVFVCSVVVVVEFVLGDSVESREVAICTKNSNDYVSKNVSIVCNFTQTHLT